ncbi:hypothetical protein [Devosia aurantiaca]|uniref:Uncharacterized protein n=1 Tax=Devosia aurantiaca TaxID=2714858 RepID=A0A6M1SWA9_9HYPH|nr:hypothetical protein [Devosia aurantiaca]NGP19275.1 hypothetical protein [Devosia aurantiaca]
MTEKWLIDPLVLGVAAGMAWTWRAAAFRAISRGGSSGTDKINLTVWLAWTTLLVHRCYVLTAGALDLPEWLTTSFVPGLIATAIFLAGMYGLSAPATGSEDLPRREHLHIIVGWFITGVVGGAAVVYFLLAGPV